MSSKKFVRFEDNLKENYDNNISYTNPDTSALI